MQPQNTTLFPVNWKYSLKEDKYVEFFVSEKGCLRQQKNMKTAESYCKTLEAIFTPSTLLSSYKVFTQSTHLSAHQLPYYSTKIGD